MLKNKHNIIPQYYGRYIDDIILGPFIKDDINSINTINLVFNSVSQDIKFIVEVPSELILNFLDISISINNNLVEYQWFVKNSHSGISLNKHSWVPHHVKSNYIKNSQVCVANKCSNQNYKDEAFSKLTHRFEMNGFTKRDISIKLNGKNKKTNKNDVPFKINFVNDTCNRKLNKLIKQCNLPIKLISKPAPTLESVFKNKSDNKHKECHLCSLLPKHIACTDRFLVYQLSCNLCNESYIGQTNRPFFKRYNEHKRDLVNKNKRNALYEHGIKVHGFSDICLNHFDVDILDKSQNAIDCRLSEARLIKTLHPAINRKHELPNF